VKFSFIVKVRAESLRQMLVAHSSARKARNKKKAPLGGETPSELAVNCGGTSAVLSATLLREAKKEWPRSSIRQL
jgi:hypothetical protein